MSTTSRLDLLEQRRHRLRNTLHTWLLGAATLALFTATAFALAGGTGLVFALVFGALSMAAIGRVSPQLVLSMYKARPVGRAEFPAGIALMEELAARADLPAVPRLHVLPSRVLNAFAVGRRDDSAIAITDALARHLTLRELAGVLAHEVSHIANEDLRVMNFADMVSRYTSLCSTFGIFALIYNVVALTAGVGPAVPWAAVLLLLLAPTIGGLLQMALSRTREFDADLGAAMLTGDPDGLGAALVKLERAQGAHWESLMLPGGRTPVPSILRSHPRTEDRLARLAALKGAVAGAELLPDTPAMPPLRRRPSLVPPVRLPPGFDRAAFVPFLAQEHGMRPARETPLAEPEGRPRIRPMRGGVYW